MASEQFDYEKCKAQRPGLYIMVFLTWLLVLSGYMRTVSYLNEVKSMQPCKQAEVK